MRASEQTIQLLNDYYAAIEANRPEDYSRYYADDMTLTFANNPTIKGRDHAVAAFSATLDRVQSLAHELVNVWEEEDGVVIFETIGTWTLHDGTRIPVNAVGIFTVVDGRFTDQRITVDNSPVFATA
jgi:ketosteroid isomerase-like protein